MRHYATIAADLAAARAKLDSLRDEGELLNAANKGAAAWQDPGQEEHAARILRGVDNARERVAELEGEFRASLLDAARSGAVTLEGPMGSRPGGGLGFARDGGRASYAAPLDWGAEWLYARRDRAGLLDSGSVAVSTPLSPTPVADGRAARFVYELCPSENAPGGRFGYMKQTVRTNNAAVVARGATKPTSVYTLKRVDDSVDVIAHLSEPIDRFDLRDAPMLTQFLNREMTHGLSRALDAELVAAIQLEALSNHAAPDLAGIRSAITLLETRDLAATAIVLCPDDWEVVENQTATAFVGTSMSQANDAFDRRLYGVPVVVTNALSAGEGIVGDFAGSAMLYRTDQVLIDASDASPRAQDAAYVADFARNQVVFRAEMRAKAAITRPLGFVQLSSGS